MGYYDNIQLEEIIDELAKKHHIKITRSGNEIDLFFCPNCKNHAIDFNLEKAVYRCHRCHAAGTFKTLYDALEGENAFFNRFKKSNHVTNRPTVDLQKLNDSLLDTLLKKTNASSNARSYLENRMLEVDTMFYQKIGYANEKFLIPAWLKKHYHLKNCITFPVYNRQKQIRNIRFKQVSGITPDQYNQGNLFNLDGFGQLETNYIYVPEIESPTKQMTEKIWIFEGEPDAILAWQILKNQAPPEEYYSTMIITTTAGANSIPKEWNKDYFTVPTTVFYDADERGMEGAKKIESISPNVRIANVRLALDDDHDKDITDFIKVVGEQRGYKILKLLEATASTNNREAQLLKEMVAFKEDIYHIIKNIL